jgi:pregnancy-associated plasma protein-A
MRSIPALAALLFAPALAASAQEDGKPPAVISVAGQSFTSWQAYTSSPLFRRLGLRCGTPSTGSVVELFPASDCTLSSTTIRPEYEPAGHTLYRIPVVVHILMSTSGQGAISDAMVDSQIDVLNEDFQALAGTLGEDGNDARIEFFLATHDPAGNPTTGITRSTNNTWFADSGNYYDTLNWDADQYLNIYTNQASGALGYVPGLPQGGLVGLNHDRVVVLWSAFGRNAPIGPPFHLGRTATHEVGHYLGLNHTFNGGCSSPSACYTTGDLICDTNPEGGPVFGCPGASNSCGLPDPYHNYMDYSDDDCYEEFTPEQNNRMRCTLANWRIDLHEPGGCAAAAATIRNGGLNVNAYSATPPVLGSSFTLSLGTAPFRTNGLIFAYAAPITKNLANGYVQLVDLGSPLYFTRSIGSLPGNTVLLMPLTPALCGSTAYTQAALLGNGGYTLTNAVDLTAGL